MQPFPNKTVLENVMMASLKALKKNNAEVEARPGLDQKRAG
jgi:ABC-type polar amino acid transport system ATPase subunit